MKNFVKNPLVLENYAKDNSEQKCFQRKEKGGMSLTSK